MKALALLIFGAFSLMGAYMVRADQKESGKAFGRYVAECDADRKLVIIQTAMFAVTEIVFLLINF